MVTTNPPLTNYHKLVTIAPCFPRTGRKSATLSPIGSFLALRMTFGSGAAFAGAGGCEGGVATARWSEGAGFNVDGAGHSPVGSTLWM